MKITLLSDSSSYFQEYHKELSDELTKRGHSISTIISKNDLEKGDIVFILSCFELISVDKLELNKYNIVIHESDLPAGKGWSPASWQILEGKNEITLSLFEAVEALDAGDIYLKDKVKFKGTELVEEWRKKIAQKKIEMCLFFIDNIDKLKSTKQSGNESFYKKRTKEDCQLDVDKTIREQFNLLRIVDNSLYPAYFEINDEKYTLKIEKMKK